MSDPDGRPAQLLIAGGGMVGACLALAMARTGWHTVVVEAFPPSRSGQASFDDRSTALSNASKRIFQSLGCWEDIAPRATPIASIHVSERGRFGRTRINASEEGVEALGYVVENRRLGEILWERLKSSDAVQVRSPARVTAVSRQQGAYRVTLEGEHGGVVDTRLLAVADGARSAVRDLLGISARHIDYGQTALTANVQIAVDHHNIAYERFTADGPMAVLPMSGRRCGVVWTVRPERAEQLLELPPEAFLREFQRVFGNRLGPFSRLGRLASYPLSMVRSERISCYRALVVGNAANSLHPVAGQGFNLALRDVAAWAELAAGCDPDDDASVARALDHYARWRRADQWKVAGFTHGLIRLFGVRFPGASAARAAGMLVFDALPGAKALLARHAMGLGGRLPVMARRRAPEFQGGTGEDGGGARE